MFPFIFLVLSTALELIKTAIEKAGFTDKVVIGMDVAASEFFIEGKYDLDFKSPPNAARNISADELASIYQGFINNYPGVYWNVCELNILISTGRTGSWKDVSWLAYYLHSILDR